MKILDLGQQTKWREKKIVSSFMPRPSITNAIKWINNIKKKNTEGQRKSDRVLQMFSNITVSVNCPQMRKVHYFIFLLLQGVGLYSVYTDSDGRLWWCHKGLWYLTELSPKPTTATLCPVNQTSQTGGKHRLEKVWTWNPLWCHKGHWYISKVAYNTPTPPGLDVGSSHWDYLLFIRGRSNNALVLAVS